MENQVNVHYKDARGESACAEAAGQPSITTLPTFIRTLYQQRGYRFTLDKTLG